MHDVTVTVVLTAYNGDKYLAKQLDSIIQQTHRNLEIIVCNDSSSDQTGHIVEQYATRDKRIFSILHKTNVGLHANLEAGLRMAKGDYIAISDQDDIWRTDKIEKLLGCMGEHIAAFSDSDLIDANDNFLGKTILEAIKVNDVPAALQPLNITRKNAVSGHALLFHKSLLSHALPFYQDLIFDHHLAIIASVRGGLAYYPEPLVLHRIHGDNHTNSSILDKCVEVSTGMAQLPPTHYLDQIYNTGLPHNIPVSLNGRAPRRRMRHDVLLHNLMIILATADEKKILESDLFWHLQCIANAMKANQHRYFDLGVYMALHRFDKKYHFFGTRKRIKLCKGGLWYKLAERIGAR